MEKRKGQKKGPKKESGKGRKKVQGKRSVKARAGRKPRLRVPPPESELWPEWCRGKLWEPAAAKWFAGRCQLCAYSCQPSPGRQRLDNLAHLPTFLVCTNHPDSPGKMRDVLPTETCRNFKPKYAMPPRVKRAGNAADAATWASDGRVRRIPLGHGLFATVDAADYKKLSRYKWCASHKNGIAYAVRRTKEGRMVFMHREIMRAPKGTVVDHINHNALNNRRCNLRLCSPEQNHANIGPRGGSSEYVGVHRRGKRWEAGITSRGVYHYVGRFDDPVEAAKARDRKAYELHGEHAHLNFPEEIKRRGRKRKR